MPVPPERHVRPVLAAKERVPPQDEGRHLLHQVPIHKRSSDPFCADHPSDGLCTTKTNGVAAKHRESFPYLRILV